MKKRGEQNGHRHDLGNITYPEVRFLSTIMAMSDLSARLFHDRGEKAPPRRRERARGLRAALTKATNRRPGDVNAAEARAGGP
jgi:hypothetical protein